MVDINKISQLACLKLSVKEQAEFAEDLQKILAAFEKLNSVNTEGIEPMVTPTEIEQHWREDKVDKWQESAESLSSAPELVGQLFKVPPVV